MKYPTLRLFDGYPHTAGQFREAVVTLQRQLARRDYAISVDGFFGGNTQDAVEAFQAAEGLVVDGIVGPRTWAALLELGEDWGELYDTAYYARETALEAHLECAGQYRPLILDAAARIGAPVAVFWAIGSRESGWGQALQPEGPGGTGDYLKRSTPRPWRPGPLPPDGQGFGRGLMQIDFDAHEFARSGNWECPKANIGYGADVLFQNVRLFRRKGRWDTEACLRMGVAGYNCGAGNVLRAVERGRDVDYYTHGRDYSRDVFSRAGWFQRYGWTEG